MRAPFEFPSASYDEWKTRGPDYYDDDPCAEVRAEMGREIDERDRDIGELRHFLVSLIDSDLGETAAVPNWRGQAREMLGLTDPNAPPATDDNEEPF